MQDGGCTHRTTQSHQTGAKDDISRYIGKNVRANTIVDVAVQPTSDTILSARSGRFTRLGHTTGVTKRNSEWPGNTVKQPKNEPVELGCAKCGHALTIGDGECNVIVGMAQTATFATAPRVQHSIICRKGSKHETSGKTHSRHAGKPHL